MTHNVVGRSGSENAKTEGPMSSELPFGLIAFLVNKKPVNKIIKLVGKN